MWQDFPGIYKIVNTANGNFYVGSTVNLRKRRNRHFSELRLKEHYNIHLQRAFQKYGENNFLFVPIIICGVDDLAMYEQIIIDSLSPDYNIRKDATSNIGVKRSSGYKKRVGEFFRGRKLSERHIKNRDKSRTLNSIKSNQMVNIQITPANRFRLVIAHKHLGCFVDLQDAIQARTDYFNSLFGGGC